ncbi:hypothetical protein BH11GEM2_BH11GEM2_14180 [soil metagenome]
MSEARRNERICFYLSASLANAAINLKLRDSFPADRFEVILPQEFAPVGINHPRFPVEIYQKCVAEMLRCDAGLLLLDAFGIDCAWESGWFSGHGKPIIGIAASSTQFLRHWMVKGSLAAVICLDEVVFGAVSADPILGRVPTLRAESWTDLPKTLLSFLEPQVLTATGSPVPRGEATWVRNRPNS